MEEISKLASQLRRLSGTRDPSSSIGRTKLEKLATIALIHDNMVKISSKAKAAKGLSRAAKLLAVGVVGAGTVGAGVVGHGRGRAEGRKKGQREMYNSALPYVRTANTRANKAMAVAKYLNKKKRKSMEKKSGKAGKILAATAAVAAPVGAYYAGKSTGRPKGRARGRSEVARSAMKRVSYDNTRFRKALNYIMSRRKKTGGGKDD